MLEPYLIICGLLLLGSMLALGLPMRGVSYDEDYEDGWDLSPREIAYLRRGPYGVVLTVLAELHGRGSVDFGQPGAVRQLDPPNDYADPLATTVYAGLNCCGRPRLLALLPSIRRSCRGVRDDLVERSLLPPARRRVFAVTLLAYAVGLAVATVLERAAEGSTVVGAMAVTGLATVLGLGQRRTLAGQRELWNHRRALRSVIADGAEDASYLADLVAADGRAAAEVLCRDYVRVGGLAPVEEPLAAPVPEPIQVPRQVELPTGWRKPVYEPVSVGPAIVVRPAFVAPRDRVAA